MFFIADITCRLCRIFFCRLLGASIRYMVSTVAVCTSGMRSCRVADYLRTDLAVIGTVFCLFLMILLAVHAIRMFFGGMHQRACAGLDVQHNSLRTAGQLFADDAGGNEGETEVSWNFHRYRVYGTSCRATPAPWPPQGLVDTPSG